MKSFTSTFSLKDILKVVVSEIEDIRTLQRKINMEGELVLNYEVLTENPQKRWDEVINKLNDLYKGMAHEHVISLGNKLKVIIVMW